MLRDYIFFGGERISVYTPTSTVLGFFDDHLGSTSKLEEVSSSGTVSQGFDSDYYPFGRAHQFVDSYDPAFKFMGKERDAETGLDNFGARYNDSTIGRFISAAKRAPRSTASRAWEIERAPRSTASRARGIVSSVPAPVPYANLTNPQTLNLYAMVSDNPETFADLDGHGCDINITGTGEITCSNILELTHTDQRSASPNGAGTQNSTTQGAQGANAKEQADEQHAAQQTYGRQPDGSYKADPAEVQAAIKAGKPILEPGNPDHKSECVFACKALSHMKNIGTSQWRKGKAAVNLNDTTDIGLAIATLGSGTYPSQRGNSGIYMGHDANGASRLSISGRIMGHSMTTRSNTR